MRTRLAVAAGAAVVLVAWPQAQAQLPPAQQTFRTGTDVVVVDVSVKRGNTPVTGLTPADFDLRDNGVRQEVESVETKSVPIDLSIIVDVSGNPRRPWMKPRSRASVSSETDVEVRRLTRLLRDGDRVRLFAIDTYVQQVWQLQPAAQAPAVRGITFDGQSSLYDTLTTVMLQPVEPTRRHVIVAATKGLDTISSVTAAGVHAIAERSDAQTHLVMLETAADVEREEGRFQCDGGAGAAGGAPRNRGTGGGLVTQGPGMGLCTPTHRFWVPAQRRLFEVCGLSPGCLHRLQPDGFALKLGAENTGGGLYQGAALSEPTLFGTFEAAFENFRQSYVLRYTARGVTRAGWHEIKVTVPKQPSLRIVSRTGYAVDVPPPAPPPASPASASAVLRSAGEFTAAYGRGEYDAVALALRRHTDPVRLIADFDRGGNPWPANPRREAVLALELAETGIYSSSPEARDDGLQLLERFGWLVRDPIEPQPFERAWLLGALTMLQGTIRPETTRAFVDRALERFPDEPRFHLARAIIIDQQWPMTGGVAAGPVATRTSASPEHVAAVTAAYETAAAFPSVRVEAMVRMSWVLHRVGRTDDALAKLVEAATAGPTDLALQYLRELLTGRVLLAKDRAVDAMAAFQRAAAMAPGASSARVGLMNALLILGRRAGAEALAETLQTTPASIVDPWWLYWQGDYRRYPETLRSLRELAR